MLPNWPMNQLRIVEKMRVMPSSSMGTTLTTLNQREKRHVRAERPPPGRPMAATSVTSTKERHSISLRSHQPPQCSSCRRISMGGCAPYTSLAGMLMSSTKMTIFLPVGGPNTPLRRLSTLRSMRSCVWLALVWALKFMKCVTTASPTPRISFSLTDTDLPVPVSPTKSVGYPLSSSTPMTCTLRTLSMVGTRMSLNLASLPMLKLGTVSSQPSHLARVTSKHES
mmetsp:Transcript_5338/g.17263  ORF Transcript_5338/g.17263 Transcript_5338/m.17263 type:complete len:225 (-) Transcript_5338:1727-2401(-)